MEDGWHFDGTPEWPRLLALALLVVAWIGGTVACVAYACRPGCAGAVLLALLVACGGWGFVQEALGRAL